MSLAAASRVSERAVARVVALGASNLTRGFQTVVSTARAAWGPGVEVLAALGHGRSYGARSQLVFRTLPGILDSGLWPELESRSPAATRALVTDVGNDILYGFSAERTLAWVEEALRRLSRVTHDIVVTDLPLASIRRLSNRVSTVESLRLYLMRSERRWVFGVEQFTPQSGVTLRSGGRVWLY